MENKADMIRKELNELLACGFTVSSIGREAGLSRGMMSLFMSGKRNCTPETVARIDTAMTTILGKYRV